MSKRPIRLAKLGGGENAAHKRRSRPPQAITGAPELDPILIAPYVDAAVSSIVKCGIFGRSGGSPAPTKAALTKGIAKVVQIFFQIQQLENNIEVWNKIKLFENLAIRARELSLAISMQSLPELEGNQELKFRALRALRESIATRGSSLSEIEISLQRLIETCDSLAKPVSHRRNKKLLRLDMLATAPLFAKLWTHFSQQRFKRDYRFFPPNNTGRFKSPGAHFVQLCFLSLDDKITPRSIKTALEHADRKSYAVN